MLILFFLYIGIIEYLPDLADRCFLISLKKLYEKKIKKYVSFIKPYNVPALCTVTHLILITPWDQYCYHPYFTNDEVFVQNYIIFAFSVFGLSSSHKDSSKKRPLTQADLISISPLVTLVCYYNRPPSPTVFPLEHENNKIFS